MLAPRVLLAVLVVCLVTGCSNGGADDSTPSPDGVGSPSAESPSEPTPSDASESPVPEPELPGYSSSVAALTPEVRDQMSASHRPGCPVALDDLRYLRLRYVGFDGRPHLGEMVVHRRHARDVADAFGRLYEARFPIERMQLVDEYAGDDDASMAANNTSAYNCRNVAGTDRWSNHAYGAAIDINPVQNPYVQGDAVDPPAGRRYAGLSRSAGAEVPRGVITTDDVVVRAFASIGWGWGGDWRSAKDYQHFSAAGG